jgi:hypothetical protein
MATFIKHKQFMNVCIKVAKIDAGDLVIGNYWNLGQSGESYPLEEAFSHNIRKSEHGDWLFYSGTNKNLREVTWQPGQKFFSRRLSAIS